LSTVRRALLMASGANRGAYYAGFLSPLQEAGIEFELLAGVSAGGIAAAWFAAGDSEALIDSWRQADAWRVAPHPWLSVGRRRTVDHLIRNITLKTMNVRAARTADAEVVVALSRVIGPGFPLPKMEPSYFSNREAASDEEFGLMLRATGFVPWINGLRGTVAIDGHHYLDGGLVHRVPFEMIPKDRYDELWIAACSPNGLRELHREIETSDRPERLVVVTPSVDLPVQRWTMDWSKISQAIELGRCDMEAAIEKARSNNGPVFIGAASGLFQV
jgi:predicted acylesterase/phospholipase RssA